MSIIVSAPVHRIEINFVRRDESTQLRISAHPPLLLGAYQFASIIPPRDGKLNIETVAIQLPVVAGKFRIIGKINSGL